MCHWSRAKIGCALDAGIGDSRWRFFHAAPQLRAVQKLRSCHRRRWKQTPEKNSTAQIQEKRDALERLEAQFAQDDASLAKRFDALTAPQIRRTMTPQRLRSTPKPPRIGRRTNRGSWQNRRH
jgi:hypothetical protein